VQNWRGFLFPWSPIPSSQLHRTDCETEKNRLTDHFLHWHIFNLFIPVWYLWLGDNPCGCHLQTQRVETGPQGWEHSICTAGHQQSEPVCSLDNSHTSGPGSCSAALGLKHFALVRQGRAEQPGPWGARLAFCGTETHALVTAHMRNVFPLYSTF